jgi:hypothetical protein
MIMRRRAAVRSVGRLAVGTAVVAGTAGAVRHHQDQKYANQNAQQQAQADAAYQQAQMEQLEQENAMQQQQIQQMQAQQAAQPAAPAPAAAPAGGTDLNSQLIQLSQLHNAGVLNDEEFAQAKAKLLAGG